MDAFCHLAESYINSAATEFSRELALSGLKFWARSKNVLTYNTGMAHGKACGYFMSGYLTYAAASDRETVLSAAGFSSILRLTLIKRYLKELLLTSANEYLSMQKEDKHILFLFALMFRIIYF